ncbi:Ail/Lom family outer membrane beta-barrel protein [Pandoraea communis]|nr:Ail/Lom family outer membrane beta-barrel protein [Pandoraea communis]MDM8358335.1 Ail/Lom family outer membrane beta-barrel protein [Pandoraea communis]
MVVDFKKSLNHKKSDSSKGLKMKKFFVFVAPLFLGALYGAAAVAQPRNTITVGYAQSQISGGAADQYLAAPLTSGLGGVVAQTLGAVLLPAGNKPGGVNLKYRYEFDENLGFIVSYTGTGRTTSLGSNSKKLRYDSLTAGPSYRFNNYFSLYAGLGASRGEYGFDINDARIKIKESNTKYGLASIVGAQVNVYKNVTLDFSYEYSKLNFENNKTGKFNTWSVALGYRF